MKVFISSVRRGLEEERDALPGLIRALGMEPIRFEDFTAQPVASREACLLGVEAADVYVLLLGPAYGDPMPGTGVSPTEEELTVARRKGIPIVAFVKSDVVREPEQEAFLARVEEYGTGLFRSAFANAVDLQATVASALREVQERPPALTFVSIDQARLRPIRWLTIDADNSRRSFGGYRTTLELHVQPLDAPRLAATEIAQVDEMLARIGRDLGIFAVTDGLEVSSDADRVRVTTAAARGRSEREAAGIELTRSRDVGVFFELPSDMLGTILDPADVSARLATAAKAAIAGIGSFDGLVAFAVGLQMTSSTVEGDLADLGRRSGASMDISSDPVVIVAADDAVPAAAVYAAASEVASELTARLFQVFRHRRRL